MKFSLSNKGNNEESLSIIVPAIEIESKISSKLNSAQKSAKIKGFRKGKAPLDIVSKIYEPEIRQEVINDAVVKVFYDQVEKKGLRPVGRPNLTPEKIDKNKDIKFKATFETYPEININNLSKLTYTKTISSVGETDLMKAIDNIRKKMCIWEPRQGPSLTGDQLKIDFVGTMDGKEFEGNSAKSFSIEIGSKSMIEGFEEGLIGLKENENKILDLKFPEDYGKSELASKDVSFKVEVKEVLKPMLPELNEEFFKKTGIESNNLNDFKMKVKSMLEEDLVKVLKSKSTKSILNSLREANPFEVPSAMIESEINNLRSEASRRMGVSSKELNEDIFPKETFEEEALKRVKISVLLNKIIEEKGLKADGKRVREIIEERASVYKEPQQVVNWFYSNEDQLRGIESISLEEQVIDIILTEANEIEEELSYEECVSRN